MVKLDTSPPCTCSPTTTLISACQPTTRIVDPPPQTNSRVWISSPESSATHKETCCNFHPPGLRPLACSNPHSRSTGHTLLTSGLTNLLLSLQQKSHLSGLPHPARSHPTNTIRDHTPWIHRPLHLHLHSKPLHPQSWWRWTEKTKRSDVA